LLGDKLRRLGGVIAILRYRVDLSFLKLK